MSNDVVYDSRTGLYLPKNLIGNVTKVPEKTPGCRAGGYEIKGTGIRICNTEQAEMPNGSPNKALLVPNKKKNIRLAGGCGNGDGLGLPPGDFRSGNCNILDSEDPELVQWAMTLIAMGGWGFNIPPNDVDNAKTGLGELLMPPDRVVRIDAVNAGQECLTTSCAGSTPKMPAKEFAFRSGNRNHGVSITEGEPLKLQIVNAFCGGTETSPFDYALLLTAQDDPSRWALVFPFQTYIVTSNYDLFEFDLDNDSLTCSQSEAEVDTREGSAIINVVRWPALDGFYRDGDFIVATPINITAHCPGDNCKRPRTRFVLCLGQPSEAVQYFEA